MTSRPCSKRKTAVVEDACFLSSADLISLSSIYESISDVGYAVGRRRRSAPQLPTALRLPSPVSLREIISSPILWFSLQVRIKTQTMVLSFSHVSCSLRFVKMRTKRQHIYSDITAAMCRAQSYGHSIFSTQHVILVLFIEQSGVIWSSWQDPVVTCKCRFLCWWQRQNGQLNSMCLLKRPRCALWRDSFSDK